MSESIKDPETVEDGYEQKEETNSVPNATVATQATSLLKRRGGSSKYGVLEEEENGKDGGSKVKYPRQIAFIIGNEFCERFSYYGMKTVLVLYFYDQLGWSQDVSTVVFHTFTMACYFFPLVGAIMADSWLGRFKTILYVSLIYALGNALLAFAAIGYAGEKPLAMIALLLIAFGTGGIKPCVSAFGGDQFILPQQQRQLVQFFSIFYFSINFGSMLSTILTPMLRSDVSCFGRDSCFFAAFGVPCLLFLVATILFVIGKPMYIMVPPGGDNLLVKFCKCMFVALKGKIRNRKNGEKKEHWIDYAEGIYDKTFVSDAKCVLRVLVLFFPLPFFWTLYDQTGSRWLFQATRLNGQVGRFVIKPDQMQAVNPVLILLFIPLFDRIIYPLFEKCHILKKPLQKMVVGGLLAALAFFMSACLQVAIEKTEARIPSDGVSHLSIINGIGCPVTVIPEPDMGSKAFVLDAFEQQSLEAIQPDAKTRQLSFEFVIGPNCSSNVKPTEDNTVTVTYTPKENTAHSITLYIDPQDNSKLIAKEMDSDEKEKDKNGHPKVRIFYNIPPTTPSDCKEFTVTSGDTESKYEIDELPIGTTAYHTLEPREYTVSFCGKTADIPGHFMLGGVYNVIVQQFTTDGELEVNTIEITTPNSIHMFMLVPQYIVITAGEIMFSITGLEFSFSQAPMSMKSILQGAWLLTTAVGNLFVIIIGAAHFFTSQANEFFLFSILLAVDMLVFALMAYWYVPYQPVESLPMEEVTEPSDDENKREKRRKIST